MTVNTELREGFTTGSAAAAAAKAGVLRLLTGYSPDLMDVPIPPDAGTDRLSIPVTSVTVMNSVPVPCAWAAVTKDGGDDPDATHGKTVGAYVLLEAADGPSPDSTAYGARLSKSEKAMTCPPCLPPDAGPLHRACTVPLTGGGSAPLPDSEEDSAAQAFSGNAPSIVLQGGRGVGITTLPGLPIPVGEAAINPSPRSQIIAAVREAVSETGGIPEGISRIRIIVCVPEGETIARNTMNPRLGIRGGISILGTRGTVKPYSHASYIAAIREGLDVARALGFHECALTTGRRSERFLMEALPELTDQGEQGYVQVADFFADGLRSAAAKGFRVVHVGCFFGKLVKMAQGHAYTHARTAPIDFPELARRCRREGFGPDICEEVDGANTARQVLEILTQREGTAEPRFRSVLNGIVADALGHARSWISQAPAESAGSRCAMPEIRYHVFHFDGSPLSRS